MSDMAHLNIKGAFLHEDIGGAVNPRHLHFRVCVDRDIGIVVDILEVDAGAVGRGEGCLQLVLLHAARV